MKAARELYVTYDIRILSSLTNFITKNTEYFIKL